MQILEVKDVAWITWIPQTYKDFPCGKCMKKLATKRLKILQDDDSIVTITLCDSCTTELLKNEGGRNAI